MKKIILKINGKVENCNVSLAFSSKNPKTNQHNVNIKLENEVWIQISCREGETSDLVSGIRAGKITDLSNYVAQEVKE